MYMYLFLLLLYYTESFSTYNRGSNELLYVVFSRRVCAAIPDSLQVVGVCTGNLQCTQNYLNRDLLWKLMFQYISINMPINRKFG